MPAPKLSKKVLTSRHTASFHPSTDTLRKNISGSMEGEATQKEKTGARGTPPISKAEITGITPHEQNGLKAPRTVARKIETQGDLFMMVLKYFEKSLRFIQTASGIVTSK
jgi:hypothetical protein